MPFRSDFLFNGRDESNGYEIVELRFFTDAGSNKWGFVFGEIGIFFEIIPQIIKKLLKI